MTPAEAFHAARQLYVERVLFLLKMEPGLSYVEVSQRTRVSLRTVARIAAGSNIQRKRGPKPSRHQ